MEKQKIKKNIFLGIIFLIVVFPISNIYGALSCTVIDYNVQDCDMGVDATIMFRMSGSSNAHAELPSLFTSAYNNNVVCCYGVTGLGNSCSGNYETIVRLSGTTGTNAHVERNDQTNANYNNQKACISSAFGDIITIGYQASNCSGYDTTLFSMEKSLTNSQVGIPSAYNNKVCASIYSQSITFNVSATSVGFGALTPTGLRYATSNGVGSATETESYTVSASTNAPDGYYVFLKGDTLKKNTSTVDAIGGTPITPTPGTKKFGIRAVATGGIGTVVYPYDSTGFAYDATGTNFTTVAQATSGDGATTTYSIRTVATIDSLLDPGDYNTNLTYIMVGGF